MVGYKKPDDIHCIKFPLEHHLFAWLKHDDEAVLIDRAEHAAENLTRVFVQLPEGARFEMWHCDTRRASLKQEYDMMCRTNGDFKCVDAYWTKPLNHKSRFGIVYEDEDDDGILIPLIFSSKDAERTRGVGNVAIFYVKRVETEGTTGPVYLDEASDPYSQVEFHITTAITRSSPTATRPVQALSLAYPDGKEAHRKPSSCVSRSPHFGAVPSDQRHRRSIDHAAERARRSATVASSASSMGSGAIPPLQFSLTPALSSLASPPPFSVPSVQTAVPSASVS